MEFSLEYLEGIKTPLLIPKTVRLIGLEGSKARYLDYLTGTEFVDELYFYHGKDQLVLDRFKLYFPLDKVGVMLFNRVGNLYLQKRGKTKQWEPSKIDMLSVAGGINAKFVDGSFIPEEWSEAALREISEETGMADNELFAIFLNDIGDHFEPTTSTYLKVFAYQIDLSLAELQKKTSENGLDDVEQWLERGYADTMREYFGEGVEKYAGGVAFRPTNFISDPEIRKSLDKYHSALIFGKAAE